MTTSPPLAERRPVTYSMHGRSRIDEWAWLREKTDPQVIAHLEAENAYTDQVLAPLEELRQKVFDEIKAHVVEDDVSAPVPQERYEYFTRTVEGSQYALYCRRPLGGGDEEVMLDVNAVAEGHEFCQLGLVAVSPDETRLAYSVDTRGDETHELRVRVLGADTADEIVANEVGAGGTWAADSQTLVYVRLDAMHRPFQAWQASPGLEHALLLQEDDDHFFLSVGLSEDQQWLTFHLESKETSECLVAPSDLSSPPRPVLERRAGIRYGVLPHAPSGRFFLISNDGAPDFQVLAGNWPDAHWSVVVPAEPGVRIDDGLILSGHLVLQERANATTRLRVLDLISGELRPLPQREEVATVRLAANRRFDTTQVHYSYESLTQPPTVLSVDLARPTEPPVVLKEQPVRGYARDDYVAERLWARSEDGTEIPVSVVRHKDTELGSPPAVVYAYGSYEISIDPRFSVPRLSLLDRGFVWAIVHPRGGGELGRAWYDGGKLANKQNTFADVVAATRMLQERGYAGRAVLRGGSAGGLMVGAVLNRAADLYSGAVAEVPFVDVLSTMSDPSLPLTITEYEEWGNPNTEEGFGWIEAYSPYDNVSPQAYPPVLATAGLNDPRVGYWEPAKWVQRLRERTTSAAPILLKTEMGAGHGGRTGRYAAWWEEAQVLAYISAVASGELAR